MYIEVNGKEYKKTKTDFDFVCEDCDLSVECEKRIKKAENRFCLGNPMETVFKLRSE